MQTKAFVCGCIGPELTEDECRFIAEVQPWGLILFKRNVVSPEQVAALTARFRDCVGRDEAPVLVDQEGGRVQRLGPPAWPAYPAAARYGALSSLDVAAEAAGIGARLIAADLRAVGITVDCAPVLDVPAPGSHQVIGNRGFGAEPESVARLGRAFAEGLIVGGVLPVMKHVPGHGRTGVDSHLELPVVTATRRELESVDFAPFRALSDLPMAMTAHLVYTAIDPLRPATTSPIVINSIVRGHIGFDGLLLSDDLSMEALKGSLGERAANAVRAGCDILLHCNGKMDEARAVSREAPVLDGRSAERAARALSLIAGNAPVAKEPAARERFAALMAAA